jgi:hypothetical protein
MMSSRAAAAPSEMTFNHFVDRLSAQAAPACASFREFVLALPGVLPDEALTSLIRIAGPKDVHLARLIADASRDSAPERLDQGRGLPLPHPLDSEFRFDEETAERLAGMLIATTAPGDEILLVGTPTVAIALAATTADRRIRFVGPDDCVTSAVAAAFDSDRLLLGEGPGRTAQVALVDPPWYLDPVRAMIGACARGCVVGASVWMVVPQIGTKPEAARDREQFLEAAAAVGLRITGDALPALYRTPLFELAAMERQGVARLSAWRRGEIVGLSVVDARPIPILASRVRACELSVCGIRLRLTPCTLVRPVDLTPIADHEVFPSISSRAPGRDAATLWTTGNRAFDIDATAARAALAELSLRGDSLLQRRLTSPPNDPIADMGVAPANRLIHQLVELIGREWDDARRLVGDGAWLETVTGWRS